jgi:hypothetical protein
MKELIHSCDVYAEPISLTYKRRRVHSTTLGGILTLASLVVVLSYFATMLNKVISKENVIT